MIKKKLIPDTTKITICLDKIIINSNSIFIVDENTVEIYHDGLNISSLLRCFKEFFLIQDGEFGEIKVYKLTGEYVKTIAAGFNINIRTIDSMSYMASRNTKTFWSVDENLNLTDTKVYFQFSRVICDLPINYSKTELSAMVGFSDKIKWKVDISQYTRNIARHPKTGEVLWDKPNEIHERPLGDDKKIYVPLTGGQLVALYAESGEKAWLWEHHRTGTYQIFGGYLYKQDGLSIFEIRTSDGTLNREKKFNDDPKVESFHASGPLWVYEDIIIVCDVLYGKICMLDRVTLDVIEFFSLEKKLINSENAIVWHKEKLYVLDIDNTLHIFEKT